MRNIKIFKAGYICSLLLIVIVGCGKNQISTDIVDIIEEIPVETEKGIINIQNEEPDSKNEMIVKEENKIDEMITDNENIEGNELKEEYLYNPIIQKVYETIICDKTDFICDDGMVGIVEICIGRAMEEVLSTIGYTYLDIDENGIKELIIAESFPQEDEEERNPWNNRVLSIYTIKENEPYLIVEGWARNRYYIFDDLSIYNEGSSGAAYSVFALYDYYDNELHVNDYYFSTEEGWYYNKTGAFDPEMSEKLEWDFDTPWDIQADYEKRTCALELIKFNESTAFIE